MERARTWNDRFDVGRQWRHELSAEQIAYTSDELAVFRSRSATTTSQQLDRSASGDPGDHGFRSNARRLERLTPVTFPWRISCSLDRERHEGDYLSDESPQTPAVGVRE